MTTVTVAASQRIRVYAYAGAPQSWRETVVHSQGTLEKTRTDLVSEEYGRLAKYQAAEFGGLMTPRAVLEYLEWRDS